MFCPLSPDWGNVANWASAVGTIVAVSVALWVATRDHSERQRDKAKLEVREAEIENAFLVEALRLYRSVRQATDHVIDEYKSGVLDTNAWKRTLQRVRESALRYQVMPKINLRAYQAMDELIDLSKHSGTIDREDPGDIDTLMASIRYRCEYSSSAIIENPNPLAPLKW